MKQIPLAILVVFLLIQCGRKKEYVFSSFPGKPETPLSIKKEHEYLLDKLLTVTSLQDSTSSEAKKLKSLVEDHFREEEDYVLPPLGILPLLASGTIPGESKQLIQLTERFKSNSAHMIAEHQMIKVYLDELMKVTDKDYYPQIIEFENEIYKHASMEEELFFPTAILIGEYLKLKQSPGQQSSSKS